MSNTKHLPLTQSERMGQFRLKIIGSLLASPPDKGDLRGVPTFAKAHFGHPSPSSRQKLNGTD